MIKLAIHHRENSFSERWIEYCKLNEINYVLVDVFDTSIIEKLAKEGVTHFMWHINHSSQADLTVYPYIMNCLDNMGVQTFPNFNTRWHFDDKVAQKYLLESIGAGLIPSYVFYKEEQALDHISKVEFPIVAKLKRGAGATNVKLLNNKQEAKEYITKMFTSGINPNAGAIGNLNQKMRIAKKIRNPFQLLKKVLNHLKKNRKELKVNSNEKGYFYYQEFMPDNEYDTRVVIVGDKAIAIRRDNRKDDFRASGSGKIKYDSSLIDPNAVKIAFEVSKKLDTQSLAFDFVYDKGRNLKIIEVCFGFSFKAYDKCPVYWDYEEGLVEKQVDLPMEMIKNFLN